MSDENTYGLKKEKWYEDLCEDGQYIFELIYKYHQYFKKQDKKYRRIVRGFQLLILFFSMTNTIVLGLKTIILVDWQIVLGLIMSAMITFITAISSYFNFEEYWMRNITIHIELNILRDNFVFEAKAGKLTDKNEIEKYRKALEDIQKKNIKYWQRTIAKMD